MKSKKPWVSNNFTSKTALKDKNFPQNNRWRVYNSMIELEKRKRIVMKKKGENALISQNKEEQATVKEPVE
ncbi:MAG: hypothetical protein GF307_12880 [candidate division Zixibacteria bacterium]|nr:hypothetical protein [candidate division Zixibacteria bacterium]